MHLTSSFPTLNCPVQRGRISWPQTWFLRQRHSPASGGHKSPGLPAPDRSWPRHLRLARARRDGPDYRKPPWLLRPPKLEVFPRAPRSPDRLPESLPRRRYYKRRYAELETLVSVPLPLSHPLPDCPRMHRGSVQGWARAVCRFWLVLSPWWCPQRRPSSPPELLPADV